MPFLIFIQLFAIKRIFFILLFYVIYIIIDNYTKLKIYLSRINYIIRLGKNNLVKIIILWIKITIVFIPLNRENKHN